MFSDIRDPFVLLVSFSQIPNHLLYFVVKILNVKKEKIKEKRKFFGGEEETRYLVQKQSFPLAKQSSLGGKIQV